MTQGFLLELLGTTLEKRPEENATGYRCLLSYESQGESSNPPEDKERLMAYLVTHYLAEVQINNFGMWLFLSVGAVALFVVFIPLVTWIDSRQKEREAFYKAETFRRLAEAPGDAAKSALEMLREQERMKQYRRIEGVKIGGLVNVGVGVGLVFFLGSLLGTGHGSPYLCGLIPGMIGVGMLVYSFFMATPPDQMR